MRAILADTTNPLHSCTCVLATEADTNDWSHKHDGLPHTLEHAIFLGSQQYLLKGVLDKLSRIARWQMGQMRGLRLTTRPTPWSLRLRGSAQLAADLHRPHIEPDAHR